MYFETLNPNPNSICQTLKPKSIKSPNPQTITNEGTFNLKKKEKIEQINRKKIKKKEGFKKWVELEARKVCFLIFFLMGLKHPYPVMECSEDQKYSVMKKKKEKKERIEWSVSNRERKDKKRNKSG